MFGPLPPVEDTCRDRDEFCVPVIVTDAAEDRAPTIRAVAGERFVNEPAALVATASSRKYFPTTELSGEYVSEVSPVIDWQVAGFVGDVHAFH